MVMWVLDRYVIVWPRCCCPFEVEGVVFLVVLANLSVFQVLVTECFRFKW